jgi:hypothetical protein
MVKKAERERATPPPRLRRAKKEEEPRLREGGLRPPKLRDAAKAELSMGNFSLGLLTEKFIIHLKYSLLWL